MTIAKESSLPSDTGVRGGSDTLLRTLTTSAPIVLWAVDANGMFTISEGQGLEALGLRPGEVVGQCVFDLYADVPDVVDHVRRGLNGESLATEQEVAGRVFQSHYTPVFDPNGNVAGVVGVSTDITERKRAEQALRASEARWRSIVDSSPDIILVLDPDGACRFANRRVAALTDAELIGRNILDRLGEAQAAVVQQALARVQASGGPEAFEITLADRNGAEHSFACRMGPVLEDEAIIGIMVSASDVTKHKQAEQALRESEATLAKSQEIARIGSWRWDLASGEIAWSDEMFRIYGVSRKQWGGDVRGALKRLTHPEDREKIHAATREALLTHGSISTEFRVVREDGSERYVWEQGEVIVDEHGKAKSLIGVVQDITERRQVEERIAASQKELSAILHSMQDTYYRTDHEGRLLLASASAERLLGYTLEELRGRRLADLYVNPRDRDEFLRALRDQGGAVLHYETLLRHKDGRQVWVETNAQFWRDEAGNILGVEGTTRDMTERKEAHTQMRKLSSALEQTADAVMITSREGVIEYVNLAFETITGFGRQDALGAKPNLVKSGRHSRAFYDRLWQTLGEGEVFSDIFINRKKNGTLYYEEKTITPLKDERGVISHFISTGKDITERMEIQERLQYLAHHDVLTQLPNRALFSDRLAHALSRTTHPGQLVALLFLDLDRFKMINDTLGHEVGDEALKTLAERLQGCLRESDTVARLGGDEFAIILEDMHSSDEVAGVARKVLEVLSRPFDLSGRELVITTSIGVSLFPHDGGDSQTLLKHADIAMYRAKEQGRNTYEFYAADMSIKAFERLSLETSLRRAVEREEFCLHYQPQVRVDTGEVVGVEALLRWRHPELGPVSPAVIVPVLEETGLIVPVGEWALQTACEQARRWHEAGHFGLRMAVNLSGRQFVEPSFVRALQSILTACRIDPRALELEITESVIMHHSKATMDAFRELGQMGVRVAVDDFGTGYSSLSYLKRFPIDTLKIDRSFVRDITVNPDDAAIAQAIIAMARSLNLHVVAEGVETLEQLELLRSLRCDLSQGYVFSAALTASEAEALLCKRWSGNLGWTDRP